MEIEAGKTYINTDPSAWPEAMRGAAITVIDIDPTAAAHQLAVAYSFTDAQGRTGEGTMQLSHAQEFLRTAKDIVMFLAPDAVCVNGDDGKLWIRSGGHIIAKGATEEAAWETARNL